MALAFIDRDTPVPGERRARIEAFYACFNQRRFADAAAMFSPDAVVEHTTTRRPRLGGDGYLEFVEHWTQGFPDASVVVDRMTTHGPHLYDIELLMAGTHIGPLDLGGGGVFKPSGARAALRLRQLLQFQGDRITYASVSFDLQDIVRQLVTIDEQKLLAQVRKIHQMGEQLASSTTLVERRHALQRLGVELDEARHVLRPYYKR